MLSLHGWAGAGGNGGMTLPEHADVQAGVTIFIQIFFPAKLEVMDLLKKRWTYIF